MKILYLDLNMGAAGDMLSAALLELFPKSEQQDILAKLNALGIPGVDYEAESSVKCGIQGTHMSVRVHGMEEGSEEDHSHGDGHDAAHIHYHADEMGQGDDCHGHEYGHECDDYHGHEQEHEHGHECEEAREDEHEHDHEHGHEHEHGDEHAHHHGGHAHVHNSMSGIAHIIDEHMQLDNELKYDIKAVYGLIAEAESHVHGVPVNEIHFHEVGNMDAIADVTAVSYMLSLLKPDRIVVSPVNTGSGTVRCAHGVMPVPAPATAYLIQGIDTYDNGTLGELLTPTGAALIKHFADSCGARPSMSIERVGYGMGKKDFDAPNCVRAILGEADEEQSDTGDTVIELAANIDDMSAEELGYAFERLLEAGALDVWTESVMMKKQRPGVVLKLLCREDMRDEIVSDVFKYTSTIGVREALMRRYTLKREIHEYETRYGKVRAKRVSGYGTDREKLEYDDLADIAKAQQLSIAEARRMVEAEIKAHKA